jgi:hypothetical protein
VQLQQVTSVGSMGGAMSKHLRVFLAVVVVSVSFQAIAGSSSAQTKVTKKVCVKVGAKRTVGRNYETCRRVGKKKFWVITGTKSTPSAAPRISPTPQNSTTTIPSTTTTQAPWVPAKTTTIDPESCKLPDRRDPSLVNTPRSLGFPLNQTGTKATGTINLLLVAAEFPNFLGKESEITKLENEVRLFDEWLAFQSNGRLKASWQFPKKFYRVPRDAASYGVVGFDSSTHRPLISDIVSASDPDVDYSKIDEMFIYMPDSLTDSEPGKNPFDGVLSQIGVVNFPTSEGTIPHIKGSGTVSKQEQYGLKPTLWALWAHDLLHTIGVEGHNPVESFTLESEDYINHVVSGWNQWLLGWMTSEQIACIEKSASNNMEVDLVPLQLSLSGHRVAIIPITETRAIVVESHRNVGYAKDLGASGILAYLMDTKNVPPYAERENTALIGSKFLQPNKILSGARSSVGKGRKSALMLEGEFAEFENIRIEYVRTGSLDKIKFSLIS